MRALNPGQVALARKCAADRDYLIEEWRKQNKGSAPADAPLPTPGQVIDDIIRDVLDLRLEYCHLPSDILGEADFSDSVPVIRVNEDHQEIPGFANADAVGLRVVIQGHELGHVRRDHGRQLGSQLAAELQTTMFDIPKRTITCPRRSNGHNQSLTRAERTREFEAWTYATAFLVHGWPLSRCEQYTWLKRCAAERLDPPPNMLWGAIYSIARELVVTPTFAVNALEGLGVVSRIGEVVRLNAGFDLDETL